jgi:hypothetical protein
MNYDKLTDGVNKGSEDTGHERHATSVTNTSKTCLCGHAPIKHLLFDGLDNPCQVEGCGCPNYVTLTEEQKERLSQALAQFKLDTLMKTTDTSPTGNATEKTSVDSRKRFCCIECSKFIEDEHVTYDWNDRPVVRHNVMYGTDIQRLLKFGNSLLGETARYETAEMYGISVEKLNHILANVVGDL